MKILMVLDHVFPPDVRVEKEARTLLKAGHEVSILSKGIDDQPGEEFIGGLKIMRTELPPVKNIFGRVWSEFLFALNFVDHFWQKALIAAIEREQPQALHVHDLVLVKTVLSVSKKLNIPLMADLHENYPEALRIYRGSGWKAKIMNTISPLWRWKQMESACLHQVEKVITVADESKDHYIKDCSVPSDRVEVIMNVEDLGYFCSLPIEKGIIKKYKPYFSILYIGTFGHHRSLKTAILAIPQILSIIPKARLILVGSGGDYAKLKELANEMGVAKAVEFTGWLDPTLFPSYIDASHVCLHTYIDTISPQAKGGAPNKVFQYMAMGKPIVVASSQETAVRIIRSMEAGLVYSAGDPQSLADAVIKLHQDQDFATKLGVSGKRATMEKYNWETEGRKLIDIYDKLRHIS
jgi:glycosyltransferase involved in cell wall biosynthesis